MRLDGKLPSREDPTLLCSISQLWKDTSLLCLSFSICVQQSGPTSLPVSQSHWPSRSRDGLGSFFVEILPLPLQPFIWANTVHPSDFSLILPSSERASLLYQPYFSLLLHLVFSFILFITIHNSLFILYVCESVWYVYLMSLPLTGLEIF